MAPDRDIFANFDRMRREIDELFGDVLGRTGLTPHRRAEYVPAVDVSYAEDPPRAVVTVALPGVRLEEIDLQVRGRELHIAGRRRPVEAEGRVYQQIEIEHGPFRRVVGLAADVVAEATSAVLEDGLLQVELPLAVPEPQTRSVPIRGAADPDRPVPATVRATPPGR